MNETMKTTTTPLSPEQVRKTVREHYGAVALMDGGPATTASCSPGCCNTTGTSAHLGYSADDREAAPDGADLGLGCGNPQAIAALKAGETVLDLGAGGGLDCFLALKQVGPTGRVIGVDMTAEMVTKARANARANGQGLAAPNLDFRLGEIEHLPVEDRSVDIILSNCVINLSPDKAAVFREAWRVLKPDGRLAISDIVLTQPLPEHLVDDAAVTHCIAGAVGVETLASLIAEAGFVDIEITVNEGSRSFIQNWVPGSGAEDCIAAATIEARKPSGKSCCGPSCCAPEGVA